MKYECKYYYRTTLYDINKIECVANKSIFPISVHEIVSTEPFDDY